MDRSEAHRRRCSPRRLVSLLAFACAVLSAQFGFAQGDALRGRMRQEAQREGWQHVDDIMVAVGAAPGARIADVGSGDGFFTVRLARAVGRTGRVTAVDIDKRALDRLRSRLADEAVTNVDVVQGDSADAILPADTFDGILIVNAYHEMERFNRTLAHLRAALKPGGRLVLVEPLDPKLRLETRDRQTRSHSISAGYVVNELRSAGFDVIGLQDPLVPTSAIGHEQWMLVARRGQGAAPAPAEQPQPERTAAPPHPEPHEHGIEDVGSEDELAAADLRIALIEVKRLIAADAVLLLHVGDSENYELGHLSGAVRVTPADLPDRLGEFKNQPKRIVAYCT